MKAFDLGFGPSPDALTTQPELDEKITLPDAVQAGWVGTDGPAIDHVHWPRGEATGLPMMHVLSLRLPEDYQRRGPEYPAIAFFQGEGQFAEDREDDDPSDPFIADLAKAVPHPQLVELEDEIGGRFALIWLTEQEFASGPTAPPADPRREGEHEAEDEGPNAWDEQEDTVLVWIGERADPNAGVAPVEYEDDDPNYEQPWGDDDFKPWVEPLQGRSHLGGTCLCVQAVPEGLTPYYLELEEISGMNLGGGNLQLDLESEVFDWACG